MVPRLRSVTRPTLLPLPRLLAVSRPALWINTVGTLITGLWLSGHLYSTHLGLWALLLYFTLPFNLLIYGLNDLSDQAEDARSGRKGGWQGARLLPTENTPLLTAILGINVPFLLALVWMLPPAASLVLALSVGLFAAYSVPPLRFKGRPVLDGLSNVAYALPLVLPALVLGASVPLFPLLALMAYSVGKHAFDAVQDIPADRESGTRTVATMLGAAGTARYALAWFGLAGLLLWGESRLVALTLWGVCGGMALMLARTPTPERAARLYPLSIVSPWLVGTGAGVQLVYLLARQG